jgi:hypothetical protein
MWGKVQRISKYTAGDATDEAVIYVHVYVSEEKNDPNYIVRMCQLYHKYTRTFEKIL